MKILYLGNNWLGYKILDWLKEQGDEIVGLVIHAPQNQKYVKEILQVADLDPSRILEGNQLDKPEVIETIRAWKPDIGISILFDYIFKPELFSILPQGIINLHPSYLPYNRGQYPNVWSIIDGTPSGVTLHYIDEGIDTGDIIAQKEVPVEPVDTGETLYRKLERASIELFKETWSQIKAGEAPRMAQKSEAGTYHRTRDVESIDEIDLECSYIARDLINILRARSFPPYRGTYYRDAGKRVYINLQLEYGEER